MKYLCLAYGAEQDWNALTRSEQDAMLAQDEVLRKRGDLIAAANTAVTTVRAWDGTPKVTNSAFTTSSAPLAGFGIIEAADLGEAIGLVAQTPCARARGAVELRLISALSDGRSAAVGGESPALTKSRLERMHDVLSGHVERNEMPGLVALVSRHGEVHVEALGSMSFGSPAPMKRDTIFRIGSITKPIAAAAAMILVEECKLRLDDSIEPWLPELANRRVLRSISSQLDDTVPALRPITVRDLFTYRMGFGSVMAMPDTHPIQRAIRELRIGGDGHRSAMPGRAPRPDEWLRSLGSLPLIAQPGERWMYNVSGDVLGVLIARVAGQSLGTFMRERIFDPLGMKDTAFHVPREKLERFPACYFFNQETNALDGFDGIGDSAWGTEPPFESAAGGLVSTIDDCFTFLRMMLDKGRNGGDMILSRAGVELMTSDQLTSEQRVGAEVFFGSCGSWGFGMSVDIARDEIFRNPGRFGWDGGFGTSAYADPAAGAIGILFTQRLMDSPELPKVFSDFWTLAYEAMA